MKPQTAASILKDLASSADPEKAKNYQRFFKTGPGQYAEGEKFLGLTVPMTRAVAKNYSQLPDDQLFELAQSEWHEARLATVVIMNDRVRKALKAGDEKMRKQMFDLYLRLLDADRVNHWDLVDVSAPTVLGSWLFDKDRQMLFDWMASENLWRRRAALLATFWFINQKDASTSLALCAMVLDDKRDLTHKASGWMLREIGKRCSRAELVKFLEQHVKQMPRTMLRYSIEHFDEPERKAWLAR